jgi:hypothetical protein
VLKPKIEPGKAFDLTLT